jgi:dTDP-4-dehydrorhamnose 3,5-epimerase
MKQQTTPIEGLIVIEPRVFGDSRGYFMESYNHEKWFEILKTEFIQDNESQSAAGVLRGLHFQKPPNAQAKLVRVVKGSVLDIALDLRKNSPTYGQHFKILLSAENKTQFFIPAGFAHGFLALENDTIFSYKCSNYYFPQSEGCILWNDSDLNIDWGINNPLVSDKDMMGTKFKDFISPF